MSSTPLFDQIARRAEAQDESVAPAVPSRTRAGATGAAPAQPATPTSASAPSSPLGASAVRALVPSALVAEINDIPAHITAAARRELVLSDDQLALVDALGDSFIRVVVDALATELDRIARDRTLRG